MHQDVRRGPQTVGAFEPSQRVFGPRWGQVEGVAAWDADAGRVTERPRVGVATGLLFFLGLGITTCGILVARSQSQFEWFPHDLHVITARFLNNNQAVLVGAAIIIIGAVVLGLAARRLPERPVEAVLPVARRRLRRDTILAIGALALAAAGTALLYSHLVP